MVKRNFHKKTPSKWEIEKVKKSELRKYVNVQKQPPEMLYEKSFS